MLQHLKKYISFHLLTSYSWLAFLLSFIFDKILKHQQNIDDGSGTIVTIIIFLFFIFIFLFFISIFIIIFVAENLINYKIKSKILLENKMYDIYICISLLLYIPVIAYLVLLLYRYIL